MVMHDQPPAAQSRAGFTFVEMLTVLMVTSILLAVAAPRYASAITRYRVDNAAQRIVTDLHYARSEAQRTSQNRTVQFNSASNGYSLLGVVDRDNHSRNFVVDLAGDPYHSAIISADFDGNEVVIFDRFGRPDSAGTLVVQSGNLQRTVTLTADGTATK